MINAKEAVLRDVAERAVFTFLEAATGLAILAGPADVFSLSTLHAAAAAGTIAALAVVKGFAASMTGQKGSASFDPKLATVEIEED